MYAKATPRYFLGCLTALAVAAALLSWLFVSSFNPWRVYTTDGIAGKIVVTVLAIMFAGMLLQFVALSITRAVVSKTANRPADDLICIGCGQPLMAFAGAFGPPYPCPSCRRWWHAGPNCYDKGRPPGPRLMSMCPRCRAAAEAAARHSFGDLEA
jgi:hypothetical protein